jgi:hypothetical protein
MEAAMTLRPNNVHHLRPHLDFIEESGGVVSRRSYRTAWLGFPRVHRWGGGASRGFCSLALAPTAYPPAPSWSLEILLRSEDDGWRSLPLVTVLAVGRGWRLGSRLEACSGRSAGFPQLGRRATVDLGSDLQHGDEPRSTRPNATGSSVCGELLFRLVKPVTSMVLARIRRWPEKMVGVESSKSLSIIFLCWGVFLHMFLDVYPLLFLPKVSACVCLYCLF